MTHNIFIWHLKSKMCEGKIAVSNIERVETLNALAKHIKSALGGREVDMRAHLQILQAAAAKVQLQHCVNQTLSCKQAAAFACTPCQDECGGGF